MRCTKCGTENPDDTQVCQSCGYSFEKNTAEKPVQKPKVSRLAAFSFALSFLSIFLFYLAAIPSLLLAIISIVKINKSGGKLKGKALAVAAIIISTIAIIITPILLMSAVFLWSFDAPPIPNDYTIADIRSAPPDCAQSYELLKSLAENDTNTPGAPAIGLSEEDINRLETINKIFKEDDYDKICAGLKSNKENILRIWQNAEKGREVLDKLSKFPEIADLTEPNIENEIPFVKNFRRLIFIQRAYICLQSCQGNEDIALKEFLKEDNIIRKFNLNARPTLVKLVCIGCFAVNIETANFITNNAKTSQGSLVLILHRFTPLTDEQLSLRNSFICEYFMWKNALSKMLNEHMAGRSSTLKFNSSLRLCKNFCDKHIALEENRRKIEELSVWPAIYPKLPVAIDPNCNLPWYYKVYNPIGSVLIEILLPAWDKVLEAKTKVKIRSDLFQIVLRKRLGEEVSLKAYAYSDEYIIDTKKKIIFSPGPDGKPYTEDDIKLVINPEVLGLRLE